MPPKSNPSSKKGGKGGADADSASEQGKEKKGGNAVKVSDIMF